MQEAMGWRKLSWRKAQICSPYAMPCLCIHRPQTHSSRPLYAHKLLRVRPKRFGSPPPFPATSLPLGSQYPPTLREDPGTTSESLSKSHVRISWGTLILSPNLYAHQTGESQRLGKCTWGFFPQILPGQCMFIKLKKCTPSGGENMWGSLENEYWDTHEDS